MLTLFLIILSSLDPILFIGYIVVMGWRRSQGTHSGRGGFFVGFAVSIALVFILIMTEAISAISIFSHILLPSLLYSTCIFPGNPWIVSHWSLSKISFFVNNFIDPFHILSQIASTCIADKSKSSEGIIIAFLPWSVRSIIWRTWETRGRHSRILRYSFIPVLSNSNQVPIAPNIYFILMIYHHRLYI